jgi:hydroxyacylglutathione hydrolase
VNVTATEPAVGTRAAWVVDPGTPVALTASGDAEARRLGPLLEAVGFRDLRGYLVGGVTAWREAGLPFETTEAIDVPALARRLRAGEVDLLDVREEDEWADGHVEGSLHVPYHDLRDGVPDELRGRDGRPLAVACSAGNRSAIAVSLLRRAGFEALQHVAPGGVADLEAEGVALVSR